MGNGPALLAPTEPLEARYQIVIPRSIAYPIVILRSTKYLLSSPVTKQREILPLDPKIPHKFGMTLYAGFLTS